MITCPFCGHENIEGTDTCEECMHSLVMVGKTPNLYVGKSLLKQRISALNPPPAVCVSSKTTLDAVLKLLVQKKIGCVLIVDEGQLQGIFSERDALMRANTAVDSLRHQPISQFMTSNPETLAIDDKIAFAVHRMDLGGYRHIPIQHPDSSYGIISVRDILGFLANQPQD